MPGGLTTWLESDRNQEHATNDSTSDRKSRGENSSPLSLLDCSSPAVRKVEEGKQMLGIENSAVSDISAHDTPRSSPDSGPKWDPFAREPCGDSTSNAFTRLLQGASSKSTGVSTGTSPASSRDTLFRSPVSSPSSWDPFAISGKENALSRILSSRTPQEKGTRTAGKRKRPASSWSGTATSVEATRLCECPVCGKKVKIELCSKHLDTECKGSSDEGPPRPHLLHGFLTQTMTASNKHLENNAASSKREVTRKRPIYDRATDVSECCDEFAIIVGPPTKGRIVGGRKSTTDEEQCEDQGTQGSNFTSSSLPLGALVDSPVIPVNEVAFERLSGAKVPAVASQTKTSCPICGREVLVERCSWHLDTECTGIRSVSETSGGEQVDDVRRAEQAESGSPHANPETSEEGANTPIDDGAGVRDQEESAKSRRQSEASQGLTALAAELKCPVCLSLFEDPHSLPCSHRFCLVCITDCFKSSKRQECPLCKIPAWKRDLTRDLSLQNIVEAYRRMAV